MIDAILSGTPDALQGRSLQFPEALHWLRVQDVVRLTQSRNGPSGASAKAFHARWPGKDDFIDDVVVYTMLYRDRPGASPRLQANALSTVEPNASLARSVADTADSLLDTLTISPRSFLLMHLVPLLPRHPLLRDRLAAEGEGYLSPWVTGLNALLTQHGLRLRHGWDPARLAMALQAMVDGFLLRQRADPEGMESARWENGSLIADTIIAFTLGVIDPSGDAGSGRAALDELSRRG